jgi:hypothetical protein
MKTPQLSDERGIALALAIFSIVIVGTLVASTFFSGWVEQRMGHNSLFAAQAFEGAEAGLTDVVTSWDPLVYNVMAQGDTLALPSVSLGGSASYTPRVTRLNDVLFQVMATGRTVNASGGIMGQRSLALYTRLKIPDINMHAAITVDGTIELAPGGAGGVGGDDQVPTGWGGCGVATDIVPGIRGSGSTIDAHGGCSTLDCVVGDPQFLGGDTTVDSTTFNQFEGFSFDDFVTLADFQVSGTINGLEPFLTGTIPAQCDRSLTKNWGEPYRGTGFDACYNYFPIIYAPGNVKINGGRGQGMLLVEGDLELTGGVELYGPVIVKGRVKNTGTGGHINGGLLIAQAGGTLESTFSGSSYVQYSSCAIARALRGIARAEPLHERAWAQVYSLN